MKYSTLNEQLTGRNKDNRKLGNNTYAERRNGDAIAIRLHQTDILTFHADGRIVANTGGWKTRTTKDRLNQYLPDTISQHRGKWTVRGLEFADGMTWHPDGTITGAASENDSKEETALRKEIDRYCKSLVAALPLPTPGAGDCFYCQFTEEKTALPLGEVSKNTDHLREHLKENYFVPSMVWRALEFCGCNPQGGGCAWFQAAFGKEFFTDRNQVGRMVKKYLHRQFGLA